MQREESWRLRYDALLDRYHAIANPPAPPPSPIQINQRPQASFVDQIIRDQAKGDARLTAHLHAYARELKANGNNEDEIGLALTQWSTTEPLGQ